MIGIDILRDGEIGGTDLAIGYKILIAAQNGHAAWAPDQRRGSALAAPAAAVVDAQEAKANDRKCIIACVLNRLARLASRLKEVCVPWRLKKAAAYSAAAS